MKNLFRKEAIQKNIRISKILSKIELRQLKHDAKKLKSTERLTYCQSLDVVARQHGFRNWREVIASSTNPKSSIYGFCIVDFQSTACGHNGNSAVCTFIPK